MFPGRIPTFLSRDNVFSVCFKIDAKSSTSLKIKISCSKINNCNDLPFENLTAVNLELIGYVKNSQAHLRRP